jgi:DNA-directed RNA polymerase I subunit RPA2
MRPHRSPPRYDMEDAMIINKSSMERGLCHGTMFKTETIDLKPLRARGDAITTGFGRGPKRVKRTPEKPGHEKEDFIDVDGLPHVGQVRAVSLK